MDRGALLSDLAFALRHKLPPGTTATTSPGGACRATIWPGRIVAEALLEHLLPCGWRLERAPARPIGTSLHSGAR
jgi:hypothetical protein